LVNFGCLAVGLHRYGIRLEWREMFPEFVRIVAATALMGVAAWGTLRGLQGSSLPAHQLFEVFVPIAVGAGVYFLLAHLLGCRSLDWVRSRRGNAVNVVSDEP